MCIITERINHYCIYSADLLRERVITGKVSVREWQFYHTYLTYLVRQTEKIEIQIFREA